MFIGHWSLDIDHFFVVVVVHILGSPDVLWLRYCP
jgi:hypothetical protein